MTNLKNISFYFLTLILALSTSKVHAAESSNCYRILMKENPLAEKDSSTHSEIWCYQKISDPTDSLYVYNADDKKIKPELAFVLQKNGILIHGSLLAEKQSVHRVASAEFNPFPNVPLMEPKQLPSLPEEFVSSLEASAKETLNFLLSQNSTLIENFPIDDGEYLVNAPLLPWRGYWWPYKGQPLSGAFNSPMQKYDRFVKSRTNINPGVAAWENSRHRYKNIWWEGHCNGWAASSVLRNEPTSSKIDEDTGIIFSVSDIKGLLAEVDYCAKVAFFGSRYRGSGNIWDINPVLFHKTIAYYIGSLGKPVAMDYRRDSVVDNHVASGYTMKIVKTGTFSYTVTTILHMHKYDLSRFENPGIAPRYSRTYKYTLLKNSNGSIIGGSWLSTNPDFLWVPLSPTQCSNNNPKISGDWLDVIRNLPDEN